MTIKLLKDCLIELTNHVAGDEVECDETRANYLVDAGMASIVEAAPAESTASPASQPPAK